MAGPRRPSTGPAGNRRPYRAYRAPGGTAAFSPSDVSGLIGWWDFSDASTLFTDEAMTTPVSADAETILGISDKSGSDIHGTISANGPTYKVNIQNGNSIGRFDFSNDKLSLGTDVTALEITADMTIAGVWKFDVINQHLGVLTYQTNAATVNCFEYRLSSTGQMTLIFADGSSADTNNLATLDTDTGFNVHVVTRDSGQDGAFFENGTANGTYTSTTVPTHDTSSVGYIGARNSSGTPSTLMDGDIGEILLFNVALSEGDRNLVESYLTTKWGIT